MRKCATREWLAERKPERSCARCVYTVSRERQWNAQRHKYNMLLTWRNAFSARCVNADPQSITRPCYETNPHSRRFATTHAHTTALEFPTGDGATSMSSTCVCRTTPLQLVAPTAQTSFTHSPPHPRCNTLRASSKTPVGNITLAWCSEEGRRNEAIGNTRPTQNTEPKMGRMRSAETS